MAQVDITVSVGSVSPDPAEILETNGATTIKWTKDSTVSTFQISGLDISVFSKSGTDGYQSTPFSVTDQNSDTVLHDYTVETTAASDDSPNRWDPRIQNGAVGYQ